MKKYPTRTATKAVIIHEGKLYCNKNKIENVYYVLPGGGQEHKETLIDCLHREVLEEVGCRIQNIKFLCVQEYIAQNHEFARNNPDFHQINVCFTCDLVDFAGLGKGSEEDKHQIGYAWLSVDKLHEYNFYPKEMIPYIQGKKKFSGYLGDIN